MGRPLIYALRDPCTDAIRYIGKANNLEARLASHLRDSRYRHTPVYEWIRGLMQKGLSPRIELLEQACDSSWKAAEVRLIAQYRVINPDLLNVASGGNQPFCSKETRSKNGRKVAKLRDQRIWRIKLMMGMLLKEGRVSARTRQKLRLAAVKAPHLFGEWAAV